MSNFPARTVVAWLCIFALHAATAGESRTHAGIGDACAGESNESPSQMTAAHIAEVLSDRETDLSKGCQQALFQRLYWNCLLAKGPDATAFNCADWMKTAVAAVGVPLVERADYLWNFLMAAAKGYRKEGNHAEAEEALSILEKAVTLGNPDTEERRLALVFLEKGDLYLDQSRLEEAALVYSRALENASNIDDKFAMRNSLLSLGRIYARQERYAEASATLSRAEQVTVEDCGRDCPLLLEILSLHARVEKERGNTSNARALQSRHQELDTLLKEIALARTYYEEGNLEAASMLAERAQTRHEQIGGDIETLIMILEGRVQLAERLGKEKQAKELGAELERLEQASNLTR